MRLSRLEIKGFKSFRDKTVLEFPDKFMGIVGPNGSGKSNITEAICFVLGKSRGLRAANLAELIFNGGIGGDPAQKATVSITLQDDENRKYRITRIVERDGTSVYKIEDRRATRQEILELVGDSEYNILLQDDITRAVEMKPQQRREVIDDLCGIGAYDEKRDKALRELEKVEERINQTTIILGQKQGYMNSLKKERDEALKYTNARDELNKTKATLLYKEINSLEKRDEKISESTKQLEDERQKNLHEISSLKSEAAQKATELKEAGKRMVALEEEMRGAKIAETRGEILRAEDKSRTLSDRFEELGAEDKDKRQQLDDFAKEHREIEDKLATYDKKIVLLNTDLEKEMKKAADPSIEGELDEVKNKVYEARSTVKAMAELAERLKQEKKTMELERSSLEERIKSEVGGEQTTLKGFEGAQSTYNKTLSDYRQYEAAYGELSKNAAEAGENLQRQSIALNRKQSELEAIMKASGGLQKAVKAVLGLKKVISGIHGPIAQLGVIEDDRYASAISAAAGARMQYVVVSTVDDAAKCIDYLRKKEIGRCTFLPIDKIKVKTADKAPEGSVGFARDFVKHSAKYKKVFDYIFGDTIVVKDIEAAKKVGIGEWRMVTLDGDLLELSGAMTGGYRPDRAEITFSNIDELEGEIAALDEKTRAVQTEYEKLAAEKTKKEQALVSLRLRLTSEKDQLDKANVNISVSSERRNTIRKRLNEVVESIRRVDERIQEAGLETTKIQKKSSADEKRLAELIQKRGVDRKSMADEIKDELRDLAIEKTKLTEGKTHLVRQDAETRDRTARIKNAREEMAGEMESLRDNISKLTKHLESLESSQKSVGGEIKKLSEERLALEEEITSLSAKAGEIEAGMDGFSQRLSDYMVEKAKISQKLEDLRKEYERYKGVELIEKSVKELEDLAVKLEENLTNFGSVNLRAVETYEVIKSEYEDITSKLETLKTERQTIFDFMDKIEQKKKETFMEAFERVKDNFERIFADLSDGKGTLIIDNPMNISEAGLLIKASPAGKKLMSLDSMSGGEKVLTSTAFLLALQQYKPAYFYIVDELDAALDHRNSMRLGEMLARSGSQFLMVTHNNNMLKHMNSAIGVSMKSGVSQIVGVRLDDKAS